MSKRKPYVQRKTIYKGPENNYKKQFKYLTKTYIRDFHALEITEHDLELKITIGSNDDVPYFLIEEMDFKQFLIIIKIIDSYVQQKNRDRAKLKKVKKNGEPRKLSPNIIPRFSFEYGLAKKFKRIFRRYVPEQDENQDQNQDSE